MVTIQTGEDTYRLVCGPEEGDLTEYGEVAVVEAGGVCYAALLDIDDHGELESLMPGDSWVYILNKTDYEVQEVEFQEGEEEEEEEEAAEEEVEVDADA
jgi:hypothetical protein